ncbi:MAG: DUF5715 family protein [Paludibacteraceae bacterium]
MSHKKNICKNIHIAVIFCITLVSFIAYIYLVDFESKSSKKTKKNNSKFDCSHISIPDSVIIAPTDVLNDQNDVHLAYAQAFGLKKVFISNAEFEEECNEVVKEQKLIRIENNPLYRIKELKHSYPYVTPEMADLLNEISYRFKRQLPEFKKDNFLFLITSALRTNETQLNLSRHNRNAAPVSAHLFGTTVDISYKNVYNIKQDTIIADYDAIQALTRAIQELRMECKLAVVRERKQACFHTTVVVCPPTIFSTSINESQTSNL